MICGHLSVALGARARNPDVSLAWFVAASISPDAIDGICTLARIRTRDGLYSHSIPAVALLGVVLAAVTFASTRHRRAAMVAGALVVVHVLLDYVTGEKVLWADGPLFGLNLYRWPVLEFALELPLIWLGWDWLRRSAAGPRWAASRVVLGAMLVVQAAVNVKQLRTDDRTARAIQAGRHVPRGALHP